MTVNQLRKRILAGTITEEQKTAVIKEECRKRIFACAAILLNGNVPLDVIKQARHTLATRHPLATLKDWFSVEELEGIEKAFVFAESKWQ
jgi:hypothetical protein